MSGPDVRTGFFEMDAAGLASWCAARGMPGFAARQVLDWVYAKGVVDPQQMTNLSRAHRDLLSHELRVLQADGRITISPLAYIRGRTIVNTVFIVDEAQNLTPHEVKTIISRAGENTKVILTGDFHLSTQMVGADTSEFYPALEDAEAG